MEPGEYGGREGRLRAGGWAVRRRERERERENALKPGREELRVGAGKKREGSRGGGRARLMREREGEDCLIGDCGGDAGVPARQKNNGPSYEDGPLEIKSWRCSTFPRKNAQYHRRWRA